MRPAFRHLHDLGSDPGRNVGGTVLIERLCRDPVGEPFHHQRTVRNHRENCGRHADVVAEEIALGQLQPGPEHFVKVGDGEGVAVGQCQRAVPACILECLKLRHEIAGLDRRCPPGGAALARGRLFAMHIDGAFVVAKPEIDRMAQPAVGGPLGESDLRDQLGSDPVRAFVRFQPLPERGFSRFARLQQLHDARELLLVEARARMTGVRQPVGSRLEHAQQQRAEVRTCVPRLGPAADDEFLFMDDLQLAPVGRPLA